MFKVGDKVVILSNNSGGSDPIGSVLTITYIEHEGGKLICQMNSGWWYFDEEIKHFEEPEKKSSDGGSTDYYNIPKGAKDIGDLINYKNMNFNIGNVFKACWRKGEKNGVSEEYDLRKMAFFVKSELERIGGKYDDIYK